MRTIRRGFMAFSTTYVPTISTTSVCIVGIRSRYAYELVTYYCSYAIRHYRRVGDRSIRAIQAPYAPDATIRKPFAAPSADPNSTQKPLG